MATAKNAESVKEVFENFLDGLVKMTEAKRDSGYVVGWANGLYVRWTEDNWAAGNCGVATIHRATVFNSRRDAVRAAGRMVRNGKGEIATVLDYPTERLARIEEMKGHILNMAMGLFNQIPEKTN